MREKDNLPEIQGIDDFNFPGVYLFCRSWGKSPIPIYIGKAKNIAERIKQQLNNHKLLKGIQIAGSGQRCVVIGEFKQNRGQQLDRALNIIERSLIRHALSSGFNLINKAGTNYIIDQITFHGPMSVRNIFGHKILIQKGR